MEYCEHPNAAAIIAAGFSGYQGQHPEKASVIILGLDANWPCKLVTSMPNLWKEVQKYLNDPVGYWKHALGYPYPAPSVQPPIHHPLISLAKKIDGKGLFEDGGKYHQIFNSYFKLPSSYADCISFLELLNVPTCINASEEICRKHLDITDDRNFQHIRLINKVVYNNNPPNGFRLILLSESVYKALRLLQRCGRWSHYLPKVKEWTPIFSASMGKVLIYIPNSNTLWIKHHHFSSFGKHGFSKPEAATIQKFIDLICSGTDEYEDAQELVNRVLRNEEDKPQNEKLREVNWNFNDVEILGTFSLRFTVDQYSSYSPDMFKEGNVGFLIEGRNAEDTVYRLIRKHAILETIQYGPQKSLPKELYKAANSVLTFISDKSNQNQILALDSTYNRDGRSTAPRSYSITLKDRMAQAFKWTSKADWFGRADPPAIKECQELFKALLVL